MIKLVVNTCSLSVTFHDTITANGQKQCRVRSPLNDRLNDYQLQNISDIGADIKLRI